MFFPKGLLRGLHKNHCMCNQFQYSGLPMYLWLACCWCSFVFKKLSDQLAAIFNLVKLLRHWQSFKLWAWRESIEIRKLPIITACTIQNLILFNRRIDFGISLTFKVTFRYFINSLWNKPQFMLSKYEAVKEASNSGRQVSPWFAREELTLHNEYGSRVILSQAKF